MFVKERCKINIPMHIHASLSDRYFIIYYYIVYNDYNVCIRIGFHERSGLRKIHMPKISILAQCCCVRFTRGSNVSKYEIPRQRIENRCMHSYDLFLFKMRTCYILCIVYTYIYIYIIVCTLKWTDKLQNDFGEYCYLQSAT